MGIRRILVELLCAVLLSAGCARAEEIVFIREGAVWLSRPDGSGAHALTGAMDARSPALSPDGARVVFHSGRDEKTGFGTLSILRVADGTVAPLSFPDIAGAEDARFCPDGKSVIFVALRNPREKSVKGFDPMVFADMSVAVAQLSTGDVRHVIVRRNALLDAGHVFAAPCMSPDGLIAYQESVDDVPGGIVVLDASGAFLTRIPPGRDDPKPYRRPSFSADGRSLLCYSPGTSGADADSVILADMRTGIVRRLAHGVEPTFADEQTVVFVRRSAGSGADCTIIRTELWRVGLGRGSAPVRILSFGENPCGR